jgi:hypothetical protein
MQCPWNVCSEAIARWFRAFTSRFVPLAGSFAFVLLGSRPRNTAHIMTSHWAKHLVSRIRMWASRGPARQRKRSPRVQLGLDSLEARLPLAVVTQPPVSLPPVDSLPVAEEVAAAPAAATPGVPEMTLVQLHRPPIICPYPIPFTQYDAVTAVAGNGSVDLRWNPEARSDRLSQPSHVAIEYSADGGAWITYPVAAANDGTATIHGLANGTAYRFRLVANLGPIPAPPAWARIGTATSSVTPRSQRDAPSLTSVVAAEHGFHLRWRSPAASGPADKSGRPIVIPGRTAPPIVGYAIQVSRDSGVTGQTHFHRSQVPQAVLRGLPDGVHLVFRVAAIRGRTTGDYGNPVLAARLRPPSEPLALQVTRQPLEYSVFDMAGKLLEQRRSPFDFVAWNAPAKQSGLPIKNYVVEVSLDGLTWTTHSRPSRPETQCLGVSRTFEVAIEPVNGTGRYFVRVAAETAAGVGRFAVLEVA